MKLRYQGQIATHYQHPSNCSIR